MADFSKGDTVRLKSGGPVMTLTGEKEVSGGLMATWFDEEGEQKWGNFEPEMLEEATPSDEE